MSGDMYNIYEVKTNLSALLKRTGRGERIIIAKAGKPVGMLGPVPKAEEKKRKTARSAKRSPGLYKGRLWVAPDAFSSKVDAAVAALFTGGKSKPRARKKR